MGRNKQISGFQDRQHHIIRPCLKNKKNHTSYKNSSSDQEYTHHFHPTGIEPWHCLTALLLEAGHGVVYWYSGDPLSPGVEGQSFSERKEKKRKEGGGDTLSPNHKVSQV